MTGQTESRCVLVGQGHQRLSDGLRGLLQASFESVFIVGDRLSLIDGAGKLQPALVVIDLALAGGELAALLAELRSRAPRSATLLLSDHDEARADAAILAAGADGVVHKASLGTELFSAVDAALAARRPASPPATR